jgi:DNA-binding PadR family transcriptional regulator
MPKYSLLDCIILSILSVEPSHGYRLHAVIQKEWVPSIHFSSVYASLAKLRGAKLVHDYPVQGENAPIQWRCHLTNTGRRTFSKLLISKSQLLQSQIEATQEKLKTQEKEYQLLQIMRDRLGNTLSRRQFLCSSSQTS